MKIDTNHDKSNIKVFSAFIVVSFVGGILLLLFENIDQCILANLFTIVDYKYVCKNMDRYCILSISLVAANCFALIIKRNGVFYKVISLCSGLLICAAIIYFYRSYLLIPNESRIFRLIARGDGQFFLIVMPVFSIGALILLMNKVTSRGN